MSKKVFLGAIVAIGAAAGIAACARSGQCQGDSANEPKPTVWDKIRQGMDEMPDDFPPRVMFDNIGAMRANTDAILTLLKEEAMKGDAMKGDAKKEPALAPPQRQ